MTPDEDRLKAKLRAIEALFAGATTPGERDAAALAAERVRAKLDELRAEAPIEMQFTTDRWSHRLLIALARRYGLKPYRYPRQRYSTVMLRAPERFFEDVFLPEYRQMRDTLFEHLGEVTDRVVAEVIGDASEPTEVEAPRQLEAFSGKGER